MKIAIPTLLPPQNNYVNAISRLGAEPVQAGADADPADFAGLLLPGGCDIDPARYGCENQGSVNIDDALDELQFTVLDRFVRAGRPVFGICRGHQCIAVYFGLRLIQHLPTTERHAREPGSETDKIHRVRAVSGSRIKQLYGREFVSNSSHHQAAAAAGGGLEVLAWSDDGVIEALGHRELPILSVQWHPERMCFDYAREGLADGALVLKAFLDRCREEAAASPKN